MVSGVVDEADVLGYKLKLVYSNGLPAMRGYLGLRNPSNGQDLGTMIYKASDSPKLGSAASFQGGCCWREKYKVEIRDVALPDSGEVHAMVIPVSRTDVAAHIGAKVKLVDFVQASIGPPAGAPPPAIQVYTTVTGVDYARLNSDAVLKGRFVAKCQDAIVQTVNALTVNALPGPKIAQRHVSIVLAQGSVNVKATIAPPNTVSFRAASGMEVGINGAATALQQNMISQVSSTPGIAGATTGTIGARVTSVDSYSTLGAATGGCTWKFAGFGYCHPGGIGGELPERIGTWAPGNVAAAKSACCADALCAGLHWDTASPGDYVKLDRMGAPNGEDGTRRQCWEKLLPADADRVSAAASLRGPLALAIAPLVALML